MDVATYIRNGKIKGMNCWGLEPSVFMGHFLSVFHKNQTSEFTHGWPLYKSCLFSKGGLFLNVNRLLLLWILHAFLLACLNTCDLPTQLSTWLIWIMRRCNLSWRPSDPLYVNSNNPSTLFRFGSLSPIFYIKLKEYLLFRNFLTFSSLWTAFFQALFWYVTVPCISLS